MSLIDSLVLAFYLIGTLAIGLYYVGRNRGSKDMFAAGGKSPWWVSGLSGFMTLKSAGTFVVWGGLAYREGVVAIAINTCIGISAILVGLFVAGRWRRTGVTTPAEFVELRFGRGAVQFYTWAMMGVRILSTGVALYAVSVMLVALVPLQPGNLLRDAATGQLSVSFAIFLFGAIVIAYTVAGGLWAVLMTDVLQFIILQLAVLFVIPLLLLRLNSGIELVPLPATFFSPLSEQYTLWFMAGWVGVHFFLVGAEWAFAQRYICVPTDSDARKSAYLFGALYLISPALWLTPPILFRMMRADANPEQAYILASQAVLPVGMLGLMMAAMFSATASAISGQINVFAGVLTEQFYRRVFRPAASDRALVAAGRWFTLLIGIALVIVALLVPQLGGAEKIILTLTGLLFGPLMAPTIWGLLSGRIGARAVLTTALVSFAAGLWVKFAMAVGAPFGASAIAVWMQGNPRITDVLIGAVLPVVVLAVAHLLARGDHPAWGAIRARSANYVPTPLAPGEDVDDAPARIVAICLSASGVLTLLLALLNERDQGALVLFGAAMLGIAFVAWRVSAPSPPAAAAERGPSA
ncbi:Na+/proline symporter [Tahibacter aquaticus]|uniref:Na+/proline symporter n=1 Tax=Tahibacter aquaticus TaxID=520092 RepID=A0A4R6Z964_9GAMM|nr:Na+:solute symporter [Tahibacter aquaticus]TDR48413.1 Na+/proline symporter [Tahibacter aquaticus]